MLVYQVTCSIIAQISKPAEYQLSAAGANIGAAKAQLYPTISLTGSAGYASTDLSNLLRRVMQLGRVDANISLPQS